MADSQIFPRYTELPSYTFTGFDTVDQCKNALRALRQGRFDLAVQLCDAMRSDDRLDACLELRCQGIDALPLNFAEGIGGTAADVAKTLREDWPRMFPKREIQKLRRWGHMTGLGIASLDWRYDAEVGRVLPRLRTWYPRWVWYNWGTRSFWMMTMEGSIELAYGTGQWLFYAPHGLYQGWDYGLVRSLMVPWLLRQWNLRDSGRYGEAYGSVTKKARFPAGLKDDERDKFLHDVAALGSETVIGLATSAVANKENQYDVEFMEVQGTGGDFFQKMIDLSSTNIAVRIIGNNLTTEVKGGSFAAAFVHEHIRNDIIQDDCDSMAESINEQAIIPYTMFNFGDRKLAPKVGWNTTPPADKAEEGDALQKLAEGIKAMVLAGVPIDAQKTLDKHGIVFREDATDEQKRMPVPIDPLLLAAGVPTINVANEYLGLEPVEGGDDLPEKRAADAKPEPAPGAPAPGKKSPKTKSKKAKAA